MKKRLLSIAIALTVAITSSAAFAAASTKYEVEHVKQTLLRSDGSTDYIRETWLNKTTNDRREDFRDPSSTDKESYTSNYLKEKGAKSVIIYRNAKGKAVSGSYIRFGTKDAKANVEMNKQYSFAAVKAEYAKATWKKEGTVKDKNGKILNKLSQTIPMKPVKKDGKSVSVATEGIQYVYIDKSTGLPVKREFYYKIDGKWVFQYSYIHEYNYVSNTASLFDTGGVTLKEIKPEKNPDQGVG